MNLQIALPVETVAAHFINSGVPHVVVPVEKIAKVEVKQLGSAIRQHEMFSPAGANVNFMEIRAEDKIVIRTYERGVEDETLACGTGVVASALIHAATSGAKSPITISVRGGSDLQVGFERDGANFRNVTLTGPAEFVFEGSIEV